MPTVNTPQEAIALIHWSDVGIFDSDGTPIRDDDTQARLMREYRDTGAIGGYFLTDEDSEDAWKAGPAPDEIDFSDLTDDDEEALGL